MGGKTTEDLLRNAGLQPKLLVDDAINSVRCIVALLLTIAWRWQSRTTLQVYASETRGPRFCARHLVRIVTD